MPYLPNELINLILSFREVNPTAKLIKDKMDYYNNKEKPYKLHCFYFDTLISYKMDKLAQEHFNLTRVSDSIDAELERLSGSKKRVLKHIEGIDMSLLNTKQTEQINIEIQKGFILIEEKIISLRDVNKKYRVLLSINQMKGCEFSNFYNDVNHSIICCGMMKKNYYISNNFEHHKQFDNKYRNEIYEKTDRVKNYTKKKNIEIYYRHLLS